MEKNNLLLVVAAIAVLVALVNTVIIFQRADEINRLVGYVTDTAEAKLEVEAEIGINFTVDEIDWGEGSHDPNINANVILDSEGTRENDNQTFNQVTQGFELQNIGNVVAEIELRSNKNASDFIGGNDPSAPEFEWKLSETGGTTDPCPGTLSDTSYTTVSTTDKTVCTVMNFTTNRDKLDIDIRVSIPQNAPIGAKTSTITATASVV